MLNIEPSLHATPQACLPDVTPPTFAGIVSALAQTNGSILAAWAVATDSSHPLEYEVYVKANTPTGLFSIENIAQIAPGLSARIFTLADGSYLQESVPYYVGVRTKDAIGNRDSNLVSIAAVSSGVLPDNLAALTVLLRTVLSGSKACLSAEMTVDRTLKIDIGQPIVVAEVSEVLDLNC